MQTYIGVKRIQAEPCEKDGKPGYKVLYPDGYESWSPKDVFEQAYFPLEKEDTLTSRDIVNFLASGDISDEILDERCSLLKIVLPTGYMMTESSAVVDKNKFDHKMGLDICFGRAQDRLMKLMGFVLAWAKHGLKREQKRARFGL